jgi:hypothetical protein
LGFHLRLRLLCLHALMIMRLGVPVVLPLLPLTLLLRRFSRLSLSSRLTWQQSAVDVRENALDVQTIQDRQDSLQQQLLQDRAENRAFMTLMLQHTGVSIPPVQSAPPPPLQAHVVSAIQEGPLFLQLVLLPLRSGRSPWFSRRRSSALLALSRQCHQLLLLPLLLWWCL